MAYDYLGEIRLMSFNFAPKGWALCNGQVLPINQNQALFSLLGTTYGGDGRTTFALPNLQGRVPVHMGGGFTLGERAGEESHTLTLSELPAHVHTVNANPVTANAVDPTGKVWAGGRTAYSAAPNAAMNGAGVTASGGGQPHSNLSPFLVVNFCICLQGIFPSQN